MSDMTKAEKQKLADDLRDMFTAKWGFGDPPPGYRDAWQRDLDTVQWGNRLAN